MEPGVANAGDAPSERGGGETIESGVDVIGKRGYGVEHGYESARIVIMKKSHEVIVTEKTLDATSARVRCYR